jgi:hypothetical protein
MGENLQTLNKTVMIRVDNTGIATAADSASTSQASLAAPQAANALAPLVIDDPPTLQITATDTPQSHYSSSGRQVTASSCTLRIVVCFQYSATIIMREAFTFPFDVCVNLTKLDRHVSNAIDENLSSKLFAQLKNSGVAARPENEYFRTSQLWFLGNGTDLSEPDPDKFTKLSDKSGSSERVYKAWLQHLSRIPSLSIAEVAFVVAIVPQESLADYQNEGIPFSKGLSRADSTETYFFPKVEKVFDRKRTHAQMTEVTRQQKTRDPRKKARADGFD